MCKYGPKFASFVVSAWSSVKCVFFVSTVVQIQRTGQEQEGLILSQRGPQLLRELLLVSQPPKTCCIVVDSRLRGL